MKGDSLQKYGELIVLGYNGSLPGGDKGRRRSKLALNRRPKANGVRPGYTHRVSKPADCQAVKSEAAASVCYTISRTEAMVVEYVEDSETDMFQVGRSSDDNIDLVVMDTVAGARSPEECMVKDSTISRFACRILVDREPPYTARIYAAGFDNARNIFLGEKALRWTTKGDVDGLTTNGILVLKPRADFDRDALPGSWREISVNGGVYPMRDSRATPTKAEMLGSEDNILADGTLIDLCGATLLWRSHIGLQRCPSVNQLSKQVDLLNATRPQCPVRYATLVLPKPSAPITSVPSNVYDDQDRNPYCYLRCGHVHGQHDWLQKGDHAAERTCPLCLQSGSFVQLRLGQEIALYVDAGQPTYAFSPCGHMASEGTCRYWSSVRIPINNPDQIPPLPSASAAASSRLQQQDPATDMRPVCPFCAVPLNSPPVRLILQGDLDLEIVPTPDSSAEPSAPELRDDDEEDVEEEDDVEPVQLLSATITSP